MKEIQTERCQLRNWRNTDLCALREIMGSPEVAESAGFNLRKPAEVDQVLEVFIRDSEENLWAICNHDNLAIGWLEIHETQVSDLNGMELGYCLNREYWGRGIMTEVMKAAIREIIESELAERLICSCDGDNIRSARVIEKCGFTLLKSADSRRIYLLEF